MFVHYIMMGGILTTVVCSERNEADALDSFLELWRSQVRCQDCMASGWLIRKDGKVIVHLSHIKNTDDD